MKIGIQTYGSRGDINPWIALGQGLAGDGHDVTLYYTNYMGEDFYQYSSDGLNIASTRELDPDSGAYDKVVMKEIYKLDIQNLTDYMVREIFDLFEREMILAGEKLCRENDLIVNNPNLYHTACLAEKHGTPRINVLVECQFSPDNRVSKYADHHINNYFRDRINGCREKLGLDPVDNVRAEILNSPWLNLLAYSRVFAGGEASQDGRYRLCGYFPIDNGPPEALSAPLQRFLDQGDPPVFFSMGSLAFFEGRAFRILDIFLEAISLAGCRAIIQGNWENGDRMLGDMPGVFPVGYIPHERVLPFCSGIVHHGGAGTSHTALLHECPSIVIAYAWDQFYWGRELQGLGASAGLLRRKYLDPLQLAGALRMLMRDPELKQGAADARRAMKRERGVIKAVQTINEAMAGG